MPGAKIYNLDLYPVRKCKWTEFKNVRAYGYTVCDGTQRRLEINYSNGIKSVIINGDNAYPYNFAELKDLMGWDDLEEVDENE